MRRSRSRRERARATGGRGQVDGLPAAGPPGGGRARRARRPRLPVVVAPVRARHQRAASVAERPARDRGAVARPTFARTAGHVVHLAVLDGSDVLYLDKVSGPRSPTHRHRRWAAGSRPTAPRLGKAILAYSEPAVVQAVLAGGLGRLTRYSITEPWRLQAELPADPQGRRGARSRGGLPRPGVRRLADHRRSQRHRGRLGDRAGGPVRLGGQRHPRQGRRTPDRHRPGRRGGRVDRRPVSSTLRVRRRTRAHCQPGRAAGRRPPTTVAVDVADASDGRFGRRPAVRLRRWDEFARLVGLGRAASGTAVPARPSSARPCRGRRRSSPSG